MGALMGLLLLHCGILKLGFLLHDMRHAISDAFVAYEIGCDGYDSIYAIAMRFFSCAGELDQATCLRVSPSWERPFAWRHLKDFPSDFLIRRRTDRDMVRFFFSRMRVASDCSLKDACKESRLYECYRSDFHPMSYVVWRIRYRAKGILAKHMRLNLCVDNSVGQRERCMYVRFQAWGITCCDAVHTGCTTKQDHTSVPGLGSCTGSFINPFTLEDD